MKALTTAESLQYAQQAGRGHLNSLEILLRSQVEGKTLEVGAGAGISAGTGTIIKSSVDRVGGIIKTAILIDLTGLSSSAAGDIIGVEAAANCHLGRITKARNGTIFSGRMTCLEAPGTGEPDIDAYSATEETGTEDAPVAGLTETALQTAAGDWAIGTVRAFTGLPADDEYVYLVGSGAGTNAVYTAGKFLIELEGYDE